MNRYEILLDKPFVIENKPIIEDKKICPDCSHENFWFYCSYAKECPKQVGNSATAYLICNDSFWHCPYQNKISK